MTDATPDKPNRLEKRLAHIESVIEKLTDVPRQLQEIQQGQEEIKKRLDTLDSRLFELSLRSMSANSSAFFGVGIAVLSAVIAYVVATVSRGGNF